MNKQKLERLIQILEDVRDNQKNFDMGAWSTECGSPSCALGWAAADPEFFSLGLLLVRGRIYFAGRLGYGAGAGFFGIEWDDSYYIFSPHCYAAAPTAPDVVIGHIREVIERNGRAP